MSAQAKLQKPLDSVDLEEVVKRWALQMFDYTKTREQAKIPKDALCFRVNWKGVRFNHHPMRFPERFAKPDKPKAQMLFKNTFTNSTNQEQEYTFKTERCTSSSCDIIMERCLVLGQEVNVGIKTPCEILEANSGFKRELAMTDAQGQCIEESLTWGVDSQVKVPPQHMTTAVLEVFEDELGGEFEVVTEFVGKVLVSVTNIRDNNSFVKAIEGDISEIVNPDNGDLKGFTKDKKVISFVNKGHCQFRYGIEQHVSIRQSPL